jgi:hypothetical protein
LPKATKPPWTYRVVDRREAASWARAQEATGIAVFIVSSPNRRDIACYETQKGARAFCLYMNTFGNAWGHNDSDS